MSSSSAPTMSPDAGPFHLGSGVTGYLDSRLGMVYVMDGGHGADHPHARIPYDEMAAEARPGTPGYADTGAFTAMGGMVGAQGMTGDRGPLYDEVNARSEAARRVGGQRREPSLLSMMKATPEEFQQMCEEYYGAESAELAHDLAAHRRSMLDVTDDSVHAGIGCGEGNSNTYPAFHDQRIDREGPFIDRSSFGGLDGQFCSRDGHAGLPSQRGSVGNGLPYGEFDGGINREGPFLNMRSSRGLSGTFSPGISRAGPSGQALLDAITEHQARNPGGPGVVGRYLWEL